MKLNTTHIISEMDTLDIDWFSSFIAIFEMDSDMITIYFGIWIIESFFSTLRTNIIPYWYNWYFYH